MPFPLSLGSLSVSIRNRLGKAGFQRAAVSTAELSGMIPSPPHLTLTIAPGGHFTDDTACEVKADRPRCAHWREAMLDSEFYLERPHP